MMASDRVGIPDIPRIKEINASGIWKNIKNEEAITDYFPEIFVSTNRVPNRDYMFRVILKDFFRFTPRRLHKNVEPYCHREKDPAP